MNDNEHRPKMELHLGRVNEIDVGMACATRNVLWVCVHA